MYAQLPLPHLEPILELLQDFSSVEMGCWGIVCSGKRTVLRFSTGVCLGSVPLSSEHKMQFGVFLFH